MRRPIPCKDCGRKDTGSASPRCPDCEKKHAAKMKPRMKLEMKRLWDERKAAGRCPRCGKRPPLENAKSCFNCGFEVEEGGDYVGAAFKDDGSGEFKRPRLGKKWLGKD